MRWFAVVMLAGCWTAETESQPAPIAPSTPIAQDTTTPRPKQSVWVGRYVCAQGPTHVVLTLDHDGSDLKGKFEFGALPENPTVPHGAYSLTGTSTVESTGEVIVSLKPGEWIERPGNYVMVGLEAHTDRERRLLTGKITNASCGAIELARSR